MNRTLILSDMLIGEVLVVVSEILGRIRYKDWSFQAAVVNDLVAFRVQFLAPDALSGRLEVQDGRWWPIIPGQVTEDHIVKTAFLAIQTAEEHEMREAFRYRGRSVFGPHLPVAYLLNAAEIHAEEAGL